MDVRPYFLPSLFFLCLVLLLLGHAFYFNYISDDAFITFRYADNFIRGKGLVYNAGERVEGYTNFLWLILLSLFIINSPRLSDLSTRFSSSITSRDDRPAAAAMGFPP